MAVTTPFSLWPWMGAFERRGLGAFPPNNANHSDHCDPLATSKYIFCKDTSGFACFRIMYVVHMYTLVKKETPDHMLLVN